MVNNENLPEEEVEELEPAPRSGLIIWLLTLGIAALFLPIYLISQSIDQAITPLATQAFDLQATLTAPPLVPQEEETLTSELLNLRGQLALLEEAPATIVAGHINWPAIMGSLLTYDANSIRLTGFNQEAVPLTLVGNAVSESAVIEYSTQLDQTGLFTRVFIQSIVLNPPPSPTPPNPAEPTPITPPLRELSMPFMFTLSVEFARSTNGPG